MIVGSLGEIDDSTVINQGTSELRQPQLVSLYLVYSVPKHMALTRCCRNPIWPFAFPSEKKQRSSFFPVPKRGILLSFRPLLLLWRNVTSGEGAEQTAGWEETTGNEEREEMFQSRIETGEM